MDNNKIVMRVRFDKEKSKDGKYNIKFMLKKIKDHSGPYPVMFKIVAIKDQGY